MRRIILLVRLAIEEVLILAWIHQSVTDKLEFICLQLSYLEVADIDVRRSGLICLSHLVQGTIILGEF